ncbi:uncharacterized protein SPPG_06860 [Spizellomyces punctatus DAOM BR117]|uniref:Rad21/Rec8-like protein N-terminal domain-containing protein n=1 Tax=Spizellomyces punctatus (strain DAOM BR117) TaxID=645134 RepID=A0A0L0HA28_SPIPD|nr:uncharacterized protein SPPG_06860 [Spizellomyces punctatus DAOM BR117]KNC97866.1 hypothetical protein SPPG_06860 [Spizellomyces punctatus DAOM BR117]|eukprot:XP_016605906.1 hypothetical protein SPPG_06860 [Spizellomyces punctatus DAOM BR117]
MFYTETLLSKKGKLAKVWLAANWERKLSKSQFLQTNIEAAVHSIIETGQQPLALRLSGQLLLGVVRIYSRKARYLLEDCTEALVKIKMAFRPGVVDMPGDHAVANVNAITLGDALTEFDILIPEPSLDLRMFAQPLPETRPSQTVSRTQDITLAEPSQKLFLAAHEELQELFGIELPSHAPEMEGWQLDLGLGEEEMAAPAAGPLLAEESIEIERAREAAAELPFSPRRESISISIEEAISGEKEAPTPTAPEISFDLGGAEPMELVMAGPEVPFPEVELPQLPEIGEEEFHVPETVTAKVPTAEAEEEVAAAQAARKEKRHPSRKRKLVVDAETELSSHRIQRQLRDTSDITQSERYVPASRRMQRLMDIRRQGASYYLEMSAFDGVSPELHILFQNRWRGFRMRPITEVTSPARKRKGISVEPEVEEQVRPEEAEESFIVPPAEELPIVPEEEYQYQEISLPHIEEYLTTAEPMPESLELREEEEISVEPPEKRRRTGALAELPEELSPPIEEAEEETQFGFSKSTISTIRSLQTAFDEEGVDLSFNALTASARRTEAARLFFELLVLKTKDIVDVEQQEPYGDIVIHSTEALWQQNITPIPTM